MTADQGNESRPTLVAGIGWTAEGFDVAVVDADGRSDGAARLRVPAGQMDALTRHLRALDRVAGRSLVCVVDSTDGMVDGGLLAAGLRVHRADPWVLPARTGFGSVDAGVLALVGARRLTELPRLVLEAGSLTGRADEHARTLRESEPATAALVDSGRCVVGGERHGDDKVVALTFDDGPRPPHTGRILDTLDRYGVPATFFCVGLHASAHTEELGRMAEAGHRLGNHTWSHPFLPDLSLGELAAQLERTDEALEKVAGRRAARLFRPPYGSRTPEVLDWFGKRNGGATMVLWDVDTGDWAMPGVDAIVQRVLSGVRSGSIVLMHDGGGDRSQTADGLPAVIEGLLERGYRFALVDELLG